MLLAFGTVPTAAASFSAVFADTFVATCAPQRLSYDGSIEHAKSVGWEAFEVGSHREFAAVMEKSALGLEEAREEGLDIRFRSQAFARTVEGRSLHLLVSFAESEYLSEVGCYLYDFDASVAVSPEEVTRVLGVEPAQSVDEAAIVSTLWGPPPSMPRTLDTYLTFIPPGSEHVASTGFDGVVLKFTTSAPDGEG